MVKPQATSASRWQTLRMTPERYLARTKTAKLQAICQEVAQDRRAAYAANVRRIAWCYLCLGLATVLPACGGSTQAEYLTQSNASFAQEQTEDTAGNTGSMSLGDMRFKPGLCKGMDLTPDYSHLGPGDLVRFLQAQNIQVKLEQARSDLYYAIVTCPGLKPVKLRVAVLDTPAHAGRDLHQAVLQHGPGAWGVHRANLAVLAPIGSVEQVVFFAARSRLACWGELIMAGRDTDFVIPGGYRQP